MTGKRVLVTGATNGIGLEASVKLARMGADVVIVGRDRARTEAVAKQIAERAGRPVEFLLADFFVLASVRQLATDYRARYDRLDVLINNAGTVYPERTLTAEGHEATLAVNHLAPFLLTRELRDLLVASSPSRVINTSSRASFRGSIDFDDLAMSRGYFIMKAYARSKLANVLFTRRLARELEGTGVTTHAVHPGVIATNIWSHAPGWIRPLMQLVARWFFRSAEQGGDTLVNLASNPALEGRTGLYFHELKEKPAAPLAQDDALADRLWTTSERLVGS
ncbi:MAG: SDR family oxidoreductase [Deltaproteobacteria bacterium]|nr:SDR family oxidoreductase [Deltaproteobacteria bacterium]